ncbi:MAG: DUF1735 domain-containing protein [Tannerella sp.]|nr:DUF1735 domain-containing protein [Tannerella sp.]
MKKLLISVFQYVVMVFVSVGFISSCAFDDPEDVYPYTSVSFAYQDYNRNIVVGEGLQLNAGIVFAGRLNNDEDRSVNYVVDPSLLTDVAGKSILPEAYYRLGNSSQIVIPRDDFRGYLSIVMDSAAFLSDPKALTGEYVLPLRLVSAAGVDTILPEKSSIRMSISYFGKQHGYYYYSGEMDKIMDGVIYESSAYSYITTETDSRRFIQTAGPTLFRVGADARNPADPANSVLFSIGVPITGTSVTFVSDPASPYEVRPSGTSAYDPATRTFHLEYEWTLEDGTVCRVVEDMVFRNRIRDDQGNGIYLNEWR